MEECSSVRVKTLTKLVLLVTAILTLFPAHAAKDVVHSPFEQIEHNFKLAQQHAFVEYYPFKSNPNIESQKVTKPAILLDGKLIVDGDIAVKEALADNEESINGLATSYGGLWPGASVYYSISSDFTDAEKFKIRQNMDAMEAVSIVRFYERTNEVDYVLIYKGSGCWSYIGQIRGVQELSLGPGCLANSTIQHELMHAIGIEHEQSRSDRNDYVQVLEENIEPGQEGNFSINLTSEKIGDYDFDSIMHYSNYLFSRNGNPTILRLDNPSLPTGGNELTATDIATIDYLYPNAGNVKLISEASLEIKGSPALSEDGDILVGGIGQFYSVRSNGDLEWILEYNSRSYQSSPVVAYGGIIYVSSTDGVLNAISPEGEQLWSFGGNQTIKGSPALNSYNEIFIGATNKLYSITPNGFEIWSADVSGEILGSPAIDAYDNIIVATTSGYLASFTRSGAVNWEISLQESFESSPILTTENSTLAVASSGVLYNIGSSGTVIWQYSLSGPSESSPIITATESIIVGASNGLHHISKEGNIIWHNSAIGEITGSAAISETGTIYVGSYSKNTMYELTNDGSINWSVEVDSPLSGSPLIADDGSVYIQGDKLYGFYGYSGGLANAPWPTYGKNNQNTKSYSDYIPNTPPIANAGNNQIVESGEITTLDGSMSTDPDGTITTYQWEQISGDLISLENTTDPVLTFSAPDTNQSLELVFRLTVTDNRGESAQDTVSVFVLSGDGSNTLIDFETGDLSQANFINNNSFAWRVTDEDAASGNFSIVSSNQRVNDSSSQISLNTVVTSGRIQFDIAVSSELDFDFLQFKIDGNLVAQWSGELNFQTVSFDVEPGQHEFSWVYQKDGSVHEDKDSAWVDNIIFVDSGENLSPVADAGENQTILPSEHFELIGTSSYDPDGTIVSYEWEQISGPEINIVAPNQAATGAYAPDVTEETTLEFKLTVTDNLGSSSESTTTVNIVPQRLELSYIEVTGDYYSNLPPNSERQFGLLAYFNDGNSYDVTGDAQWNVSPQGYASFSDDQPGLLLIGDLNTNQEILVSVSYAGMTQSYYMTIFGEEPELTDFYVDSFYEVYDNSSSAFLAYAIYSDGSQREVTTEANYSVSSPDLVDLDDLADGVLTVFDVEQDFTLTLVATYENSTFSQEILVVNQDKITNLEITNTLDVLSKTKSHQFQLNATKLNGETFRATDLATWSVSNINIAQIEAGLLTISENINDAASVTIFAELEGQSTSFTVSIDANVAPEFTSQPVTNAIEQEPYRYNISAEDFNNDDITFSSEVTFGVDTFFDFENVKLNDLPFTFSGDADWEITSSNSADGSYSIAPPVSLNDGQAASITLTIEMGAGEFSFDLATSTEESYDTVYFFIDGLLVYSQSGFNDFQTISFVLDEGLHSFEWKYEKDASVSSGSDIVWVDNIRIPKNTHSDGSTSWLYFNDLGNGTAELFGIPNAENVGNYSVTISASDGVLVSTQEFNLIVEEGRLNPLDYDGDGKADISIRRAEAGYQFIKESESEDIYRLFFGSQGIDIPINGDFDGDGIADISIYRPGVGYWFIKHSSDGRIFRLAFGTQDGDIPVPADYDGDGITDIAVRRPSTGQWIIRPSNSLGTYVRAYFGSNASDVPVQADYDGDGLEDIAIWRPSTQQWIIRYTTDNSIRRITMGESDSNVPVTGDYDGDGKADFAVRVPQTGMWHILKSSENAISSLYFGSESSDIPVQGDYDGDGKTDIAIRRPDTATFIIKESNEAGSIKRLFFGSQISDLPLASPMMIKMAMLGLPSSIENEFFPSSVPTTSNVVVSPSTLDMNKFSIPSEFEHESTTPGELLNVSELEEVTREFEFKVEYLKAAPEKEKVPMNNTH